MEGADAPQVADSEQPEVVDYEPSTLPPRGREWQATSFPIHIDGVTETVPAQVCPVVGMASEKLPVSSPPSNVFTELPVHESTTEEHSRGGRLSKRSRRVVVSGSIVVLLLLVVILAALLGSRNHRRATVSVASPTMSAVASKNLSTTSVPRTSLATPVGGVFVETEVLQNWASLSSSTWTTTYTSFVPTIIPSTVSTVASSPAASSSSCPVVDRSLYTSTYNVAMWNIAQTFQMRCNTLPWDNIFASDSNGSTVIFRYTPTMNACIDLCAGMNYQQINCTAAVYGGVENYLVTDSGYEANSTLCVLYRGASGTIAPYAPSSAFLMAYSNATIDV